MLSVATLIVFVLNGWTVIGQTGDGSTGVGAEPYAAAFYSSSAGGGYGAGGTARLGHAKGNPLVDLVREPADRSRTKMDGPGEPPLGHGSVEGGLPEATAPEYLVAADDLQRSLVGCNGPWRIAGLPS